MFRFLFASGQIRASARSVASYDRMGQNNFAAHISKPFSVWAARENADNLGVVDAGKTLQVTLSTDLNTAEPGKSVRFRLSAVPDSFVGLLAVDQMPLSVGMARENADNPGVVDAGKTLFSTAEPGESVRFRLSAAPNSFVGLLAGDHGMRRGMIGGGRESFVPPRVMQSRAVSTEARDQIRAEVCEKYSEMLEKFMSKDTAQADKWNEMLEKFVSKDTTWTERWNGFAYFAVSLFLSIVIGMVIGFVGLFWSMMLEFGRLRDQIVAEIRK